MILKGEMQSKHIAQNQADAFYYAFISSSDFTTVRRLRAEVDST